MDPLFVAQVLYRRRKWKDCIDLCTQLLSRNQFDKVHSGGPWQRRRLPPTHRPGAPHPPTAPLPPAPS